MIGALDAETDTSDSGNEIAGGRLIRDNERAGLEQNAVEELETNHVTHVRECKSTKINNVTDRKE